MQVTLVWKTQTDHYPEGSGFSCSWKLWCRRGPHPVGGWREARGSGGDGHVVPVAGWPLGDAVAAQVLVDVRHLLSGGTIGHVHGWVAAVGLRAPRVHRLQQVLAVQHADLRRWRGGEEGAFSFLFGHADLRYDGRVSPARWSVCSWRCWSRGAPLQNTGSLLDLGREPGPPGTAAELEHTKEKL